MGNFISTTTLTMLSLCDRLIPRLYRCIAAYSSSVPSSIRTEKYLNQLLAKTGLYTSEQIFDAMDHDILINIRGGSYLICYESIHNTYNWLTLTGFWFILV